MFLCTLVCLLKPPFFISLQIQDRRLRVVFSVALAREVRLHFPQLIPPRLRAAACSSNMQVKSEVALMPLGQTAELEESRVTALVAMPFSLSVTRVSRLLMRVEERPSSVMTQRPHLSSLPAPYPDLVLHPDLIVGSRLGLDPVHCSVAPSSLAPPRPSPDQDEESRLFLPPAPYLDVVVGSRWVWIPSPSRRPSLMPG